LKLEATILIYQKHKREGKKLSLPSNKVGASKEKLQMEKRIKIKKPSLH